MIAHGKLKLMSGLKDLILISSDEPELEFSGSSRARKVPSRAELGHFNFRAETELNQKFFNTLFPKFLLLEVLYHTQLSPR